MISYITRDEFLAGIGSSDDPKADAFAKTFVGKADKQDMWGKVKGIVDEDGRVKGAIITTMSKGTPKSANLQLMHTFSRYRGQGIGKQLVEDAIMEAVSAGCKYFRVSAERNAVGFYQKCGIPFLGLQKSGTFLALFNLEGPRENLDAFILDKALNRNGRIYIPRCEAPNKHEEVIIENLREKYLYPQVKQWQEQQQVKL